MFYFKMNVGGETYGWYKPGVNTANQQCQQYRYYTAKGQKNI
jgi:hypothetical protein